MSSLPLSSVKTKVPESLKADMPPTRWGKILGVTPVVLTVVATLAGLSSGEMTQAQYNRSLAAQLQAKAGDQWNFFQGKKLRSAVQRSALDQIAVGGHPGRLDPAGLQDAVAGTPAASVLTGSDSQSIRAALIEGVLPTRGPARPSPSICRPPSRRLKRGAM